MARVRVVNAPVLEAKHGITNGKVFEVLRLGSVYRRYESVEELGISPVWVMGDAGEEVKLFSNEYEVADA